MVQKVQIPCRPLWRRTEACGVAGGVLGVKGQHLMRSTGDWPAGV